MRWDIKVGAFATLLAAVGLGSSILSGNETLLLTVLRKATIEEQKALFALTGVIGGMTAFKWWRAKRDC
jgi:hypothetical protein